MKGRVRYRQREPRPILNERDWAFVRQMLGRNGPCLVRTQEKHIVEVREVSAPVVLDMDLSEMVELLQGGVSCGETEAK